VSTTAAPPSLARALADQLGTRRRRVRLNDLWQAFLTVAPDYATSPDRRAALAACLDELQVLGLAELPTGKAAFERSERPPLPRSVRLTHAPPPPSPRRLATAELRRYPWLPKLAFVGALKSVRPEELLLLQRVNTFLRDGGSERPRVPWQERSLELFGDEKFLEPLLRGRLFEPGRLSLADLAATFAAPPIAIRRVSDAPAALVVENSATFHTLAALLPRHGTIGVLAYGDGFSFIHGVASLRDVGQLDQILYFGDIDTAGLHIATEAAKLARRFAQLPEIWPAEPLYRLLLAHGQLARSKERCAPSRATALAAWLPNDLRADVAGLLRDRNRLAQEAVGYELLSRQVDLLANLATRARTVSPTS
jgi:hypothetical protein